MNQNFEKPDSKELENWINKSLGAAVSKYCIKTNIDKSIIEAKSDWVLPFQLLIGRIRLISQPTNFIWLICGQSSTDFVDGTVATTAREAAKHFSLKWQLTAYRIQDENNGPKATSIPKKDIANNLVTQAETLYSLVENNLLWKLPEDITLY